MYIIINEDCSVLTYKELTEDVLSEAEEGWTKLICISGPQPTQYRAGEWYGINEYSQ